MGEIMATEAHESFVRWQTVTREYFSTVSNLVLGLATGLLAFLVSGLSPTQPVARCLLVVGSIALALLALSVALAIWCAINRLRDFRGTAQIARRRDQGEHIPSNDRNELKIMGQLSWRLFWWQLVLFAFGAGGVSVVVLAKLWG